MFSRGNERKKNWLEARTNIDMVLQRRGFHNIGLEAQSCKKNGFLRFAYPGNSTVAVTFLANGLVVARAATSGRDVCISRERPPWLSFLLGRKDIEMSLKK